MSLVTFHRHTFPIFFTPPVRHPFPLFPVTQTCFFFPSYYSPQHHTPPCLSSHSDRKKNTASFHFSLCRISLVASPPSTYTRKYHLTFFPFFVSFILSLCPYAFLSICVSVLSSQFTCPFLRLFFSVYNIYTSSLIPVSNLSSNSPPLSLYHINIPLSTARGQLVRGCRPWCSGPRRWWRARRRWACRRRGEPHCPTPSRSSRTGRRGRDTGERGTEGEEGGWMGRRRGEGD